MWLLGGWNPGDEVHFPLICNSEVFHNDVWSTIDGVSWTRAVESAPWPPRGMIGGAAVHDGRMWILGGGMYDTPASPVRKFYNDVWSSADGVDWTELPDTPWAPRHAASVFVHDESLWMVAGNNMEPDVWRLSRRR